MIENSPYDPDNDPNKPPNSIDEIIDGFGIWATGTGSQILNINGLGASSPISTFESCEVGIYSRDVNLTVGDDASNIGSQHIKMTDVNIGIQIEKGINNSINLAL